MASVIELLETGLYNKLNVSAVTDLTGGTIGIFSNIAPPEEPLPYVIFQWQGGGDENQNPSRMRNTVYTVKAVSDVKAEALDLDEQIDIALHNQVLTITGYSNFWLAREGDVNYSEVEEPGDVIRHIGGLYRIRISES